MYHPIIPDKSNTPSRKAPERFLSFADRWLPEQYYKGSALLDSRAVSKMVLKRNLHYKVWLEHWGVPQKKPRWQAIRILEWKDSGHDCTSDYWFKQFVEGTFMVYENPITFKEKGTGQFYQYYLVCAEHCYEINKQLDLWANRMVPKRKNIFLPETSHLTTPRVVPVELCHHMRHETVAGQLPDFIKDSIAPQVRATNNELVK